MAGIVLLHPTSSGSFHTARNSIQFSKESSIKIKSDDEQKNSKQSSGTSTPMNTLKPALAHKRVQSNPFDILYGSDTNIPIKTPTPPSGGESSDSLYLTKTYKEIEQNIIQGKNATSSNPIQSNIAPESYPMITIIDERNSLKRSGSIVSQSATLRHRNNVLSRNKIIHKKDVSPNDSSNSRRFPKLKKLNFPVKRKTSLNHKSKYTPIKKNANFQTENDLLSYFENINAAALALELMPKKLSMYQFDKLAFINPHLTIFDKSIELKNHQFNVINRFQDFKISAPLANTLTKNSKPIIEYSSSNNKVYFDAPLYLCYKNAVFSKRCLKAPKFADIYPYNNELSKYQMHRINKTFLFEILLRRTLAAKISYRLKQDKVNKQNYVHSSSESSFSSQAGSIIKRRSHRAIIESQPSSFYDDSDVDNFLKPRKYNNPDPLPSPQISYQTDIFGSLYTSDHQFTFSYESILKKTNLSVRNSKPPSNNLEINHRKLISSPEESFINDFNKTYMSRYDKKNIPSEEYLPLSSNNFQLKPIKRSTETLSVSDTSSNILENSLENLQYPSFTKHDEKSSSTKNLNRNSRSIDSGSILRSLDDLSSELSSFTQELELKHKVTDDNLRSPMKEDKHLSGEKEIISLETSAEYTSLNVIQPNEKQDNSERSLNFKSIKMGHSIEESQNKLDLRSMVGSISMVETSSSIDSRSYTHSKMGSNNLNPIEEETSLKFNSSNHLIPKKTNYVIGRQDSNSTRSEMSNLNKDVQY